MTIQEFLDKYDELPLDTKELLNAKLTQKMTQLSINTLLNFRKAWDYTKPFEEYEKEASIILKKCVEMELSEVGCDVRKVLKMPLLTKETLL